MVKEEDSSTFASAVVSAEEESNSMLNNDDDWEDRDQYYKIFFAVTVATVNYYGNILRFRGDLEQILGTFWWLILCWLK